jgi:dienelactone hydrolase
MTSDGVEERLVTLAGVPALAAFTGEPAHRAERGTVLLLHGFTAAKEMQRTEAHSLARNGYLAVTLDAVGHGVRRPADFEERFTPERAERSFFELVQQGAGEMTAVLDALVGLGWAHPGHVGACGISMGGITLFGAIAAGCAIDAAVTIVATPRWRQVSPSPHDQLDRFFPTALFMQTATDDVTVSPIGARELHRDLLPRYATAPERLRYLEHRGEPHMFSEHAWHLAWQETLAWFDHHLA